MDTLSIATVPERNRSSATLRAVPDGSPSPESVLVFRPPIQPASLQSEQSLLLYPPELNREHILLCGDQADIGLSSAMQVSFVIHLQDPVESLPNVVNTDSD